MHKFNKNNLSIAKKLRNNATTPEKILWNKLKNSQLNGIKFRRQQPIGPYIVDFASFYPKIVIELDGGQHNNIQNLNKDIIRDNFLTNEGFLVLRIWNNDIYTNLEGTMEYFKKETSPTPESKIQTLPSMEGKTNTTNETKSLKIQCPAKINLNLKITGKREDGFHDIESIMQTISLYDYLKLTVEPSDEFKIQLSGTSPEIPYNEKNLVYKAIKLFLENIELPPHKINVHIEKNIPISAGLAGGSTDAAGILLGLNEIFDKPFQNNELHSLCAKLGSDLNFCLEGGRQMTSGRGEILQPLPFEEFNLALIKPITLGISAKEAYTKFSQKKSLSEDKRSDFENDLEWAVFDDYKELQRIKNSYPNSMMSGSGSTYFVINENFEPQDGFWIKNELKSINHGVKIID